MSARIEERVYACQRGDSWLVRVDGKTACVMSTGGPHLFRTQGEAEYHGRQYLRGWTGGTFLSSEDV